MTDLEGAHGEDELLNRGQKLRLMGWWVKYLPSKHEGLCLECQHPCPKAWHSGASLELLCSREVKIGGPLALNS